ncbi:MAG TPA: Hsp20/alpha crystallin family protein [Ilumatobacter sp.]
MTKKSTSATTVEKTAAAMPAVLADPFSRIGLSEWFDRWPELFARRWPEAFHGMPFIDDGFRMEQFVEDDGTVVVRGELPGLDPDRDVEITVDADRMTISASRQETHEDKHDHTYRSEFRYGSFERSVRLPVGARADAITATYVDGILEVRVPVDTAAPSVTTVPIAKKK